MDIYIYTHTMIHTQIGTYSQEILHSQGRASLSCSIHVKNASKLIMTGFPQLFRGVCLDRVSCENNELVYVYMYVCMYVCML